MKKSILILFFYLFSTQLKAEYTDTCKFQAINIDIKKDIISGIYNGFMSGNFDKLVIFCDNNVDFFFKIDSTEKIEETVTDYRAIYNLNGLVNYIDYNEFSILSAKTEDLKDVIIVRLFLSDKNEVDIFFSLNYNNSITKIAVYR